MVVVVELLVGVPVPRLPVASVIVRVLVPVIVRVRVLAVVVRVGMIVRVLVTVRVVLVARRGGLLAARRSARRDDASHEEDLEDDSKHGASLAARQRRGTVRVAQWIAPPSSITSSDSTGITRRVGKASASRSSASFSQRREPS